MVILIVDDHHVIHRGIESTVSRHMTGTHCLFAECGADALFKIAHEPQISLVITDLELIRGEWALGMVKEIREQKPGLGIIVHSKYEEKGILNQCLRAGASAYCSKRIAETDFVKCITNVMRAGRTVSSSEALINHQAEKVIEKAFLTPEEKFRLLSEREKEVAHLLYENYSRKRIADQLFIGTETVKTHTRKIYDKLGIDSRAKLQLFFEVNYELLLH